MSDIIADAAIRIIRREIRKACPGDTVTNVWLDEENEQWLATINGEVYACDIGSDDDAFTFTNIDGELGFSFPIPSDWPV